MARRPQDENVHAPEKILANPGMGIPVFGHGGYPSLSAGVLQLPRRVKRTRTMDDGITFVVELRRGDEYRAAEIEELERPDVEADTQVKQIYDAVRRLLPR